MSPIVYDIKKKLRPQGSLRCTAVEDFELAKVGSIDVGAIRRNERLSLYCLDHSNRRAVFVETSPDVDLLQHPLFYQAQYVHAHRVVAVPYEAFHELALNRCQANFSVRTRRG